MMGGMAHERIVPGDVLRRALALLRAHFALLYPLALIFGLIQAMVTFALRDTSAAGLGVLVGLVASTFLTGIVVGFVRDVEAGLAPGEEPSVGALFKAVAPLLSRLVLVSLLSTVGIVLGLFAFIVPGLWLLTMWAVVAPVVVLEKAGVFDAFRRSRELVSGNGREVFVTLLLLLLLLFPVAFVAAGATAALGDGGGAFVEVLFSALATTLTVVATSTLYFRLLDVERHAGTPAAHPGDAWVTAGSDRGDATDDTDGPSGPDTTPGGLSADPRGDGDAPSWPPPRSPDDRGGTPRA